MKKISMMLLVAVFMLGMVSCSTGRYLNNSVNGMGTQTQVVLSNANFKIVKTVQTTVVYKSSLKFTEDQLKQSAYAALLKEANLQGSQALVNVTMENIVRAGFIKVDNAILVTGTVIEFTK